jgi:hypothetical protein
MKTSFTAIKATVEAAYPLPVAAVFRKTRTGDHRDLGGRHKNLTDLFEVLVKFLCITQLQDLRRCLPDFKNHLPQQEKTLEFLTRPSLGGWVGLFRVLNSIKDSPLAANWANQVRQWYLQGRNPATVAALQQFEVLQAVNYNRRSDTPHAELCNALVTYRNKFHGHGANLSSEELKRRNAILEGIMAYLLDSAGFLAQMRLVYTDRIELAEDKRWVVHGVQLNGVNTEPVRTVLAAQLNLKTLYLMDETEQAEPVALCLEPFFLYLPNPAANNRQEVFVYNDAMRTRLDYMSYFSGDHHHHKEIHAEFQDMIRLKVQPGVEEDAHLHMDPEQRREKAETLRRQADYLRRMGKLEDALETTESALEYQRAPDVIVERATLQHALGEGGDSVRQTLLEALDLDPDHPEALALMDRLDEANSRPWTEEPAAETSAVPTLYHYLTPARVRRFVWLLWPAILSLWYIGSMSAELAMHNLDTALATGLMWFGAVVTFGGVLAGYRLTLSLRSPLSLQLGRMKTADFDAWHDRQIIRMFGNYARGLGDGRFRGLSPLDQAFVAGLGLWAVGAMVIAGYLCGIHALSFPHMIKRAVDIGLFYAVVYPGLRYLIMSTIWLFRFGDLSLKPTLTRSSQGGLRSLTPMIKLNLMMYLAVHCSGWSWSLLLSARHSPLGDVFFMTLSSLGFTLWSVGIPMAIRRAMRESKTKTRFRYDDHVERAFHTFMDKPGDDTLAPFQWLVKHESVIDRIGTWPMGRLESILWLGGTNLVLAAFWMFYVLVHLDLWGPVRTWLGLG